MVDASPRELALARRVVLEWIRHSEAGASDTLGGRAPAENRDAPVESTAQNAVGSAPKLDTECADPDSPIIASLDTEQGTLEGIGVELETTEYESEWWWEANGSSVDQDHGRTAYHTFIAPGRHSVALRSLHGNDRPGTNATQTVCIEPVAALRRAGEEDPALAPYLAEHPYPRHPDGTIRWFTADESFVDADPTYRWRVDPVDGGPAPGAEIREQGFETVPIDVHRPGEFGVSLVVETADGLSSERVAAEFTTELEAEIDVVERRRPGEGAGEVDVAARHPFREASVTHRWYLDRMERPVATGPRASLDLSELNHVVRLGVEAPNGSRVEARSPLVGTARSVWETGAVIQTSLDASVAAGGASDGDLADAAGRRCDDVLVLDGPRPVRFTSGHVSGPGVDVSERVHDWTVSYSRRFREGVEAHYDGYRAADDVQTEYEFWNTRLEPRDGVLVYPFAEPGWYAVELELRVGELPREGPLGDSPRHDYVMVYVMGLEDPADPWTPREDDAESGSA